MPGIFASLKDALVGRRCHVELEGLPTEVRSLADLNFTVVLRGGPTELRVRELSVCIEEERLIHFAPGHGDWKYWDTAVRALLPLPRMLLAPHENARVPVSLPLPELEPSGPLRRYRLCINAEVPGFNPRVGAFITVTDAAELGEAPSPTATVVAQLR